MPITAAFPIFQSHISQAFNLGPAADQGTVATIVTAGMTAGIPLGLLPSAPSPIPLTPSGASAFQSQFESALRLGLAADVATVSQLMAIAVSVASPMAPPSGLSGLQSAFENALSLGPAADPNTVSQLMAQGIVQYYVSGGIL